MKKNKTKILSLLLVALFIFFAVASGSDSEEVKKQEKGKADTTEVKNDSSIGDYEVEILACRLSKDYEGKDAVIITYKFTNISGDEPASFMFAFDDTVYQNGVECNSAIMYGDDSYDEANQLKEIKAGASLEVECAYVLNDTTSDVEVEVKELFTLYDEVVITKIFEIA